MQLSAVFGGILLVYAIYKWLDEFVLRKRCSGTTTGTIISLDVREEIDFKQRRNYFAPVYAYEVDGMQYQSIGKEYSIHPMEFEIGSSKEIRYNPSNPSECICNGKSGKAYVANFVGCIGLLLIALSFIKSI